MKLKQEFTPGDHFPVMNSYSIRPGLEILDYIESLSCLCHAT